MLFRSKGDRCQVDEAFRKVEAFGCGLRPEEHDDGSEETASGDQRSCALDGKRFSGSEHPRTQLAERVRVELERLCRVREGMRRDELDASEGGEPHDGHGVGADMLDQRRTQKGQHPFGCRCIRDDACKLHERIEGPTNHVAWYVDSNRIGQGL